MTWGERGMGPRIRRDNGWGMGLHPSAKATGRGGMGPRIRGDNEGDGFPHPRGQRGGWVHAYARTTGGGWVHPSAKATGRGGGWVCTPILTFPPQGGREGEGWVHAFARITGGDGFPHPSSWGQVLRGGTGMGPRIREDNEGDGSMHPRGQRMGWVPASARTTRGMGPCIREDNGWDGSPHPRGQRVGARVI